MSCICCRWFFRVSQLKVQEPSGGCDESACGPPFSHTCILSTVLPASPEAVLCTAVGGTVFQHSPTESIKAQWWVRQHEPPFSHTCTSIPSTVLPTMPRLKLHSDQEFE